MTLPQDSAYLPKGWAWIPFSESVEKIPLTGRKLKQSEYLSTGNLPVIDQGQTFIGGYTNRKELRVSEKPVLIFGDHTKVLKYVEFEFVAGADGVKVIKPGDCFFPKLLYYFLQTIDLPEKGYARHFQFLERVSLPLPPLPEQRRIVAKIEELFTRLDAGVEALKKIKAQLKRYRQAVLKYAFEGKLTAQWREKHKDELEPASVLLERIKAERKKNASLRETRRQAKAKYKELPPLDTSGLPELPHGWIWTNLCEIAERINPGFPSGKHNKEKQGVPHVRPMNISAKGEIDLTDTKYVQPVSYDPLLKGDVLFNNTNSPELIGKTACIRQDTNWAYSNHMTRIRFNTGLVNPCWIALSLHALFLTGFFKMKCTHHVNQASINTTFLGERTLLRFPPLFEQQKIVEEIERRFSVADEIEKVIERGTLQAERLRQSILKRAFEGKLVSQDPTDEPAEKLLERIRNRRHLDKQTGGQRK